ncbi:MAG: hypothetical protein GX096_04190 [Clostridiales bacterium]|nr:hypothetical protein [Clostridiales bacterium]
MSTFETDKAGLLWNGTAIPNAFICEYMPAAPESHVKVYLYGLMLAHAGVAEDTTMLDDVAKALGLERAAVEAAFRYWERCRLIERIKDRPPVYRYLSVQQAMFQKQQIPRDEAYENFALAIYGAFGERRKLHGGETVLAYEWVEQLKLPAEVVMMLIQHMIATRGVQFSFKEAQKLATEMSEEKIRSIEDAEEFFGRSEAVRKGTRKVLSHMGKRRNPTKDESNLYIKWTSQWSFTPEGIEIACEQMTKGDPSFAYLDKILEGIASRSSGKKMTGTNVEKQLTGEKDETARMREMLVAVGIKKPVLNEGMRLIYRNMLKDAEHDVILLAAHEVGKRSGTHSLDDVPTLLESWRERGLTDANSVSDYLGHLAQQNKRLKELFSIVGKECGCNQQNRERLSKWQEQWRMPEELLEQAAEYSRNVDYPMPYMDKLITSWHDAGIATLEGAMEDRKRFTASQEHKQQTSPSGEKKVIEQKYEQRTYDPDEFSGLSPDQLKELSKYDA